MHYKLRKIESEAPKLPEPVPGMRVGTRFSPTGVLVTTFTTLAIERDLPIGGDVLIIDERRQNAAASQFNLPPPPARSEAEGGADGVTLRIISTCDYRHVVLTRAGVIDGKYQTIEFEGFGSIELYARGGKWVVLSSHGVTLS